MSKQNRDKREVWELALLSRRTLLRGGLGVSVAGVLAACTGSDEEDAGSASNDNPTTTGAATPTTDPTASAFPVTIEHKYGSTEITEQPAQAVALGSADADMATALGIVPVIVPQSFGVQPGDLTPWLAAVVGDAGVEVVDLAAGDQSAGDGIPFERVAAANPDVILAISTNITEQEYATLSEIAPTLAPQIGDYLDPWQDISTAVGMALGQHEEAGNLVDEIEAGVAEIAGAHPEFAGKEFVVTSLFAMDQFGVLVDPNESTVSLMLALGLSLSPEVAALEPTSGYATQISRERIDLLDTDALLAFSPQSGSGAEVFTSYQEDPLFQQLDVVQSDAVVGIEPVLWGAFRNPSVLTIPYAVDEVVPRLAEVLGGTPVTEATAPAAAEFPVTIEHEFGASDIPAQPERVVTIGYTEQDPVLALDVQPVAVREWFGDQPFAVWPWATDELGDAEPQVLHMPFGELDFEKIAALHPDVLLATHSGITEDEYATLAQIAPTVAQSSDYPDFGMPWQEQTRIISRALGQDGRADELVSDVEAEIAATAEAHPEFTDATITWIEPAGDGQYWVVGPTTPPLQFLQQLGFRMTDELIDLAGDADSAEISSEQLHLADTDVLITPVGTEEEREALESNDLFQQLGVVQEDRTIFFVGVDDPIYGALSFSTVLSLPFALDELTPMLVEALAGELAVSVSRRGTGSLSGQSDRTEGTITSGDGNLTRTFVNFLDSTRKGLRGDKSG